MYQAINVAVRSGLRINLKNKLQKYFSKNIKNIHLKNVNPIYQDGYEEVEVCIGGFYENGTAITVKGLTHVFEIVIQ